MNWNAQQTSAKGRVTRVDIAADFIGLGLNDLIVLASRKQKHGVYSNRYGEPETVYLGTPRSARVVAYTRPTKLSGVATRLECRLKPRCLGEDIASLPNPDGVGPSSSNARRQYQAAWRKARYSRTRPQKTEDDFSGA